MAIFVGYNIQKRLFLERYLLRRKILLSHSDIKMFFYKHSNILVAPDTDELRIAHFVQKSMLMLQNRNNIIVLFYSPLIVSIKDLIFLEQFCTEKNLKLFIYSDTPIQYGNHNFQITNDYLHLRHVVDSYLPEIVPVEYSMVFLGVTNVGKSSIMNVLLQADVVVVADTEHTTKEALYNICTIKGRNIAIYDTYGLNNKTKTTVNKLHNLLCKVDRVILVVDDNTYYRDCNNYVSNFLKNIYCTYSIFINKHDRINKNMKECIDYALDKNHKFNSKFYVSALYRPDQVRNIVYKLSSTTSEITWDNRKLVDYMKPRFKYLLYMKSVKNTVEKYYVFYVALKRKKEHLFDKRLFIKAIYSFTKIQDFPIKIVCSN